MSRVRAAWCAHDDGGVQLIVGSRRRAIGYNQYGENIFVNDISLKDGGVFDLNQNWSPPDHSLHREGRNVDIRL